MNDLKSQLITDSLKRFEDRFVQKVTKQVDTSNSIELPLWKNNHAHLSRDISDFLTQELSSAMQKIEDNYKNEISKLISPEDFEDPSKCFSALAAVCDKLAEGELSQTTI